MKNEKEINININKYIKNVKTIKYLIDFIIDNDIDLVEINIKRELIIHSNIKDFSYMKNVKKLIDFACENIIDTLLINKGKGITILLPYADNYWKEIIRGNKKIITNYI
jgi:hypothetical protein